MIKVSYKELETYSYDRDKGLFYNTEGKYYIAYKRENNIYELYEVEND